MKITIDLAWQFIKSVIQIIIVTAIIIFCAIWFVQIMNIPFRG